MQKPPTHEASNALRAAYRTAVRRSLNEATISAFDRVVLLGWPVMIDVLAAANSVDDIRRYEKSCATVLKDAHRAAKAAGETTATQAAEVA